MSPSSRRRFFQGAARGSSPEDSHPRGTKPSALRLAWAEASMNLALPSATNTASGRPAPRCAPLRLAPGCEYAEQVWSMQASGLAGRMNLRSTKHHQPNQPLKRTRRTASPYFAGLVPARRLAAFRSASRLVARSVHMGECPCRPWVCRYRSSDSLSGVMTGSCGFDV